MEDINLRNYAYLGDAVWELHIRKKTIFITNNAKKLHQITTDLVKTGYQSDLIHMLEEKQLLTDTEQEITRRARNLPIPVGRRHIQSDYRQATAFEALVGWWYKNDLNRLEEILSFIDKEKGL